MVKFINDPIVSESSDTLKKLDYEYNRHLAAIVQFSDDAIISNSLDGTIKSWNRGGSKMFGYTNEEMLGKNISIIIPPEYLEKEKSILKKIIGDEVIEHYETFRMRKNAEVFYVSLTVSPLKDIAGNITGVSSIVRDITALRTCEAELKVAGANLLLQNEAREIHALELVTVNKQLLEQLIVNETLISENQEMEDNTANLDQTSKHLIKVGRQLTEANLELESFTYSVSHDLRAPLRAIHGYSQILKANFEKDTGVEANRLIDNIIINAKKMGRLIDGVLIFSRIARKELVEMNIPMTEMVTNFCNEIKDDPTNSKLEFHIAELPPARADNESLKQVWLNLISNAVKYSRIKEHPVIEIGYEIKGSEIIYYIRDNGAGFDMRYVDKLFGVFQRLHSDDEFEGTGVGLAIVKRIIMKHGGRIWAEGAIDKGATFYFTLNKIKDE